MTFIPVDGSVSGPKQPEDPNGYGTRYGGRVAVQGGRECLAVSFNAPGDAAA
ncbi:MULTISPECIES: hypothetical protein [Streptomyces]|uniref:hypothetical protein n=1 Tax=Streptomyces TaxID=1883 RepID=UPI0033B2EDFF